MNTIYALKNKINSKVYIGQTWKSLKERWNNGHGYIGSHKIHNAIKKYGDKFYYEVITFASTQETADALESFMIEKFNSVICGYNISLGGSKLVMHGRKHTKESKDKMSVSHIGNTAHLGKKHSDETKKRLSEATTKQIEQNGHPSTGRKHSIDSLKKMSDALKGKPANSGSFIKGVIDNRNRNRLGKTWKMIDGKRVWSDSE